MVSAARAGLVRLMSFGPELSSVGRTQSSFGEVPNSLLPAIHKHGSIVGLGCFLGASPGTKPLVFVIDANGSRPRLVRPPPRRRDAEIPAFGTDSSLLPSLGLQLLDFRGLEPPLGKVPPSRLAVVLQNGAIIRNGRSFRRWPGSQASRQAIDAQFGGPVLPADSTDAVIGSLLPLLGGAMGVFLQLLGIGGK